VDVLDEAGREATTWTWWTCKTPVTYHAEVQDFFIISGPESAEAVLVIS
jgi:hypothetical protein